jgi:hypothetical protein
LLPGVAGADSAPFERLLIGRMTIVIAYGLSAVCDHDRVLMFDRSRAMEAVTIRICWPNVAASIASRPSGRRWRCCARWERVTFRQRAGQDDFDLRGHRSSRRCGASLARIGKAMFSMRFPRSGRLPTATQGGMRWTGEVF